MVSYRGLAFERDTRRREGRRAQERVKRKKERKKIVVVKELAEMVRGRGRSLGEMV